MFSQFTQTIKIDEEKKDQDVLDTSIQDLENSPHICISVELIRHLLDPFPSMTLLGVLRVTSDGISTRHSDNKTLLAEFQVSRAWFEYDFGIPDSGYDKSIPIRFDVWLEVLKSHAGNAVFMFWPETRIIKIIYPDTKPAQLREESSPYDSASLKHTLDLFPAVDNIQYPFASLISRNELSHQIVLALIDPTQIYIGICSKFIIFYVAGSGTIIPCETLDENHRFAHQGYMDKNQSLSQSTTKSSSNMTFNNKKTRIISIPGHSDTPLIVQSHSIRNLSIIARSRYGCDKLIIAFSLQGSIIISYPIKPYGCVKVDKDCILQETAYFRYTLLANEKINQDCIEEPPAEIMKELISKLKKSSLPKNKAHYGS